MKALACILLAAFAACGGPAPGASAQPAPALPTRVSRDSGSASLIPSGFGTLRQEDVSITLQQNGVRISAIPLDETVIRTLAPDSYRSLHATVEARRQQILQRAS